MRKQSCPDITQNTTTGEEADFLQSVAEVLEAEL